MSNPYLDELMKIAEDMSGEQMNPDAQVRASESEVAENQFVSDEELAAAQAELSAQGDVTPSEAETINAIEQEIAASQMSPEETAIVEQAIEEEAAAQAAAGVAQAQPAATEGSPAEEQLPQPLTPEEVELLQAMEEEQVANEVTDALREKIAGEMMSLATIAKVIECSKGGPGITDELQKEASHIIEEMLQGPEKFNATINKVANEIFGIEQNVNELFSKDGVHMVFEQLASLDAEGFDKQADEEPGALARLRTFASDAITEGRQKVVEAAKASVNLKNISRELDAAAEELKPFTETLSDAPDKFSDFVDPERAAAFQQQHQRVQDLKRQQMMGRGVVGGGLALGAAGAAYGGKKLYDYMHQDPQAAAYEEKIAGVLPATFAGGTLNVGFKNENTGGIQKMSQQLVNDFLKIAGAAGLVSITANEGLDMELRKEASDAFDVIANMGRSEMDEQLVKVAYQIYSEDELREIVAGAHTEELFEKVAFFVDAVDAPVSNIMEKVANAGGVSAVKNIGPGLKQSATNILNTIKDGKEAAEGVGRKYVGALKGENGRGAQAGAIAGTGLAGGGLVGGGLAGYNALQNPQKYNMEQTAADLEEAVLAKQAAVRAYQHADEFIKSYGHIIGQ